MDTNEPEELQAANEAADKPAEISDAVVESEEMALLCRIKRKRRRSSAEQTTTTTVTVAAVAVSTNDSSVPDGYNHTNDSQPAAKYREVDVVAQFKLIHFSDEVLYEIFKHLDTATLLSLMNASEHFYSFILDNRFWRCVDLSQEPMPLTTLEEVMERTHKGTKVLKLRGFSDDSDESDDESYGFPRKLSYETMHFNKVLQATLATRCSELQVLELQSITLDFSNSRICQMPATLKRLVINDCPVCVTYREKSMFSGIDTHFLVLEELAIENCDWFEPYYIMSFSKLPALRSLSLKGCSQLMEFVPYGSMAARFGFKTLEFMDLRFTPIRDADFQCFNAVPTLKEVLLDCPDDIKHMPEENPCCAPRRRKMGFWSQFPIDLTSTPTPMRANNGSGTGSGSGNRNRSSSSSHNSSSGISEDYEACDQTPPPRIIVLPDSSAESAAAAATSSPSSSSSSTSSGSSSAEPTASGSSAAAIATAAATASLSAGSPPGTSRGRPASGTRTAGHARTVGANVETRESGRAAANAQPALVRSTQHSALIVYVGVNGNNGVNNNNNNNNRNSNNNSGNSNNNGNNNNNNGNNNNGNNNNGNNNNGNNNNGNNRNNENGGLLPRSVRRQQLNDDINEVLNHPLFWDIVNPLGLPNNDQRGENSRNGPRRRFCDSYSNCHVPERSPISDRSICCYGRPLNPLDIGVIWIHIGNRPSENSFRRFSVRNYKNVTDISLSHLRQCSPHLEFLDVSGTGVTREGVLAFKQIKPNCQIVVDHLNDDIDNENKNNNNNSNSNENENENDDDNNATDGNV